ncbi:MAG: CHAT domain-containing protein, partial [Steroidobacter sp.]
RQATHALRTRSMAAPSEPGDAQAPVAMTRRGAVIHYLVRPERTRVLLTHNEVRTSWDIPVESEALNRSVFELRQALQNPRNDPRPASRQLHRLLLQPLEHTLRQYDVDTLTLILDGALRYVPFGVLHDGERYLIERYAIEVQTAASAVARTQAPGPIRIAALGVTRSVAGLPPLPRVRAELERIVDRGGSDRDGVVPGIVALDQAFTHRQLDGAFGGRFALVHLASHFVFRPGALTDSWLVLGDGQFLTLASFKDQAPDLSAVELLTLSACSTALADDAGAGRELESFGAVAQRLGARDVLATLWPVADMSTTMLMTDLYRRLYRGLTTGDAPSAYALRQAQLGLLRPASRYAPYRHPFYWAPFVLFASR